MLAARPTDKSRSGGRRKRAAKIRLGRLSERASFRAPAQTRRAQYCRPRASGGRICMAPQVMSPSVVERPPGRRDNCPGLRAAQMTGRTQDNPIRHCFGRPKQAHNKLYLGGPIATGRRISASAGATRARVGARDKCGLWLARCRLHSYLARLLGSAWPLA